MSSLLGGSKGLPTVVQSPISMLSHDVLALIFEINSEINSPDDEERPINSARAASQVCQKWRTLLLDFPKIWGRLIDLNGMAMGKSEWREEVLRRTQSSPLWITGTVPGLPTEDDPLVETGRYFIRLLKSWNRIQKIDVEIYGEEISWEIQDAFSSPAPLLESFTVDLTHFQIEDSLYLHTLLPNCSQPIFANHAPSLVLIKADRLAFRTDSPWLVNLREITIPTYMEAPGILNLLSHTPLLETLSIFSEQEPETWNPFDRESTSLSARIDLPHLSALSLAEHFSTCTVILNCISPAKNCALSLACTYNGAPAHIQAAFVERLTTYILNYFTARSESAMEISIRLDAYMGFFVFEEHPPKERSFRLTTDTRSGPEITVSVIQAFIVSIKMRPRLFKKVTKLRVHLRDILNSAYIDIYDMLLMFQSAEHLVTDEADIHTILKLSPQDYHDDSEPAQPELFPSLHTLEISQISEEDKDNIVLQFLERRRHVGLAISQLDLTSVEFKELPDYSVLERIDGLEVVWNDGESRGSYICGRGESELLRFNSNISGS